MRSWSFPIVRLMGVEVRMHIFFMMLLALCMVASNYYGSSSLRGVGLWLLVVLAVAVRETARAIVGAYYGLELRNILLLPIGGLFAHTTPESAEVAGKGAAQTTLALAGPLANVAFATVLGGMIVGTSPGIHLMDRPWVTPVHLLRSAVWISLFLAAINLLPAYPLDAGRLLRGGVSHSRNRLQATRAASGLGQVLAILLVVTGIVLMNPWLMMAGFFILIGGQLEDQGNLFQSVVETVCMRDVMLTDFSMLSPSDTLEDALHKATHSLQDDFPVVRSGSLVGVISKQNILEALNADGNGYVQGIMTRAFHVALPEDSLGTTFNRISGGRGLSLVPVLEGERIIGIVTLQNLMHSMGLLAEGRKLSRQEK